MVDAKLIVRKRIKTGSANARRMRKEGILPGVVYADGKEAVSVEMDMHAVEVLLHHHTSEHLIIDVSLDGKDTSVLIKDVEHHPVTSDLVHIDLMTVDANKAIHALIPVELVGECEGVKAGGILDHLLHEINVECLPGDLVEVVEVDVSGLAIGAMVTVADLDDKGGTLKFLMDDEVGVATVAGKPVESDDEASEGAAEVAG
jgi:large subunit ribosomal protein L25